MKIQLALMFLLLMGVGYAAPDFDTDLTPEEEATFDSILSPIMKIYRFVQYAATMIGVLMLAFAGISFVTSGGDQLKKERAKQMATGVVIGLSLIWIAPLVVMYIVS